MTIALVSNVASGSNLELPATVRTRSLPYSLVFSIQHIQRHPLLMSVRSGSLEFSIRGDALEQNRIQLEQNLQHTDLSLHLSSAPEDSDVEYPRHNSGPQPLNGFASFDHISRDHFDPDESHFHPWSYRTVEDENGVNPYENRTISTAAHHASALTLSAGLAGRGTRRDISMSGAEYDPDRPLTGIIPAFGTRIPGIDGDSTRSRHLVRIPVRSVSACVGT